MKHRPIVRDGAAFVPPRELVDKVDKLLDGDAGSRRLTFVRFAPSVPASPTPAQLIRRVFEARVLENTD